MDLPDTGSSKCYTGDFTGYLNMCENGQRLEVNMRDGSVHRGAFQKGLILKVGTSHIPLLAANIRYIKREISEPQNFPSNAGEAAEPSIARESAEQSIPREGAGPSIAREGAEQSIPREGAGQSGEVHPPHGIAIPTHSYQKDCYQLYGLPVPMRGEVLVLAGNSRLGKTTVCNLLTGEIKPNLCDPENPPDWPEVLEQFSGSESLQSYLRMIQQGSLKISTKAQKIETIRETHIPHVKKMFLQYNKNTPFRLLDLLTFLQLPSHVMRTPPKDLSDQELQLVAIASTVLVNTDVYAFDDPFQFLSGRQKWLAAKAICSTLKPNRYVFITVLPEDLSIFEDLRISEDVPTRVYLICGKPQVFGEVKEAGPVVARQ